MCLATGRVITFGSFEIAAMLNIKFKVKPAKEVRTGMHAFTKKLYVFNEGAASKTVNVYRFKKFVCKLQEGFSDSD